MRAGNVKPLQRTLLVKHKGDFALMIFFLVLQITAFDELQADFKVPIDQGNPLHAVSKVNVTYSMVI